MKTLFNLIEISFYQSSQSFYCLFHKPYRNSVYKCTGLRQGFMGVRYLNQTILEPLSVTHMVHVIVSQEMKANLFKSL